jgi:hypothetical protein
MKRLWILIAVFAVIGGLIAGYFLLSPAAKKEEAKIETIEIVALDKEKLSTITLIRKDSTLKLAKKGEEWTVVQAVPVHIDQIKADDVASVVTALAARSVVEENPNDLAQYGLASPRVVAKAVFTDGTEKTFHIGDRTPSADMYYFQLVGDPKVYTVWSYVNERYRYTVSDMRDKFISPSINPDEITYLRVRQRDGTVIEIKEKTQAESQLMYFGFGTHIITRPYAYTVGTDSQKADPFIRGPSAIEIKDFVEDNPKELSRYGLDKPWAELLVRDKANTLQLAFGKDKDADTAYFTIVGRPGVYTVEKSLLAFLDTKAFELVDRFAFISSIDHVDRIELMSRGKTHVFTLARTVTKKAEKEGEQDEIATAYTADGKSADEKEFKNFYQVLIGLITEGDLKKPATGTPELTVKFFFNIGTPPVFTISYIPYNKDFYGISVNGKQSFAISKAQVATMLAIMDKFLAGEKISNEF